MATKLKLRPYARILNMLGDQLIRNERVALIEIIKNSYDADASWVKVTFEGFSESFEYGNSARIIIEDDGLGMDRGVIKDHWLNPATPVKLRQKATKPRTEKGRVIQGEKGIGRFALLKLGQTIKMTTRSRGSASEEQVILDLFQFETLPSRDLLFLDDIEATISTIDPARAIRAERIAVGTRRFQRRPHGTRIEISNLHGKWSLARVEEVVRDVARLQSIFDFQAQKAATPDFDVTIYRDANLVPVSQEHQTLLAHLVSRKSVLRVENGHFDDESEAFTFVLNGSKQTLPLRDPELGGIALFKRHFAGVNRRVASGSFAFEFYAFDFSADASGRFKLDDEDREAIRQHRIYLYRDGIRVYPYGDPDDDWLQIDVTRGTVRASQFLSNDQVVGFVAITQRGNPRLVDKTSREGLIDTGDATFDFVFLLRLFLAWLRKGPYERYRRALKKGKQLEITTAEAVQEAIDRVAELLSAGDPAASTQLSALSKLYKAERSYLVHRAETTEHLAGVGLSVETASHDLMLMMGRAVVLLDSLIKDAASGSDLDKDHLIRELMALRGSISFVETQMKGLQQLFRSTKQRPKDLRVREIVDKVFVLFKQALDRAGIETEIEETGGPLVAKTTDAVLLQTLLNLFDNALYWLETISKPRRIRIAMNGVDGTLIFADNGPGIAAEDRPYIFEPFFSGKGEDGRGLGLYIARQLLERHDYSIELADLRSQKLLRGACFVVSFVRGESE